ncbi:MAG: prohibitin family protein [Rickettsiales bacterium]|jgi:regulator of protease activity HflC (stomatin/prohibitin superfamily)|nr:prohibitin family protein [Rickettsiales bacterium]
MKSSNIPSFGFKFIKNPGDPEQAAMVNMALNILLILVAILLLSNSFATLAEGEVGVRTRLGKAASQTISAGMYFKIPFVDDIKKFDIRTQKRLYKASSYTRDIQTAEGNVSLSFSLEPSTVIETYKTYGLDWENRIIPQNLEQVVKSEIGKWDAVSLIANRDVVTEKIAAELKRLFSEKYPVRIESFQLVDLSYSNNFERAIEAKVIAIEKAKEAENKTKQIQEEANQKLISAKAEAESMRIRANALVQNKSLIDYEAVQKWDGKLPQYMMGSSVPFVNLGAK